MVDRVGRALDRLIGIFSPRLEIMRITARRFAGEVRNVQYAAAKSNRLTGDWYPVNQNVNSFIGNSNATIRSRVRQLVRDFPYFARAVNVLVNFSVGQGLTFQSRVKDSDGKLHKAVCQKIEDAVDFWADEADVSRKLHFYEIMRLTKRQDVESGEFIVVKVQSRDKSSYCPFALQVYEADWLSSAHDTYSGGGLGVASSPGETVIWQGVEFEKATGRVLAFWFTDPDSWGKDIRIPADQVIHGFDSLRPGQLRGVSPFAPAVLVAHDLGDFMDAEIDGAKMAAKWLAMVETPDPALFQAMRAGMNPGSSGQKIEELENTIIEYLRPGEKVTLAAHNRPGESFDPFTRFILRMVAVTVGISYELLAGDYQGLNYTVLRGVRNDLTKEFIPIQKRHERQFCRPIFKPLMDSLVLSGRLPFPDYFRDPSPYLRSQWIPPGMSPVDPLKEGRADADAVKALLKSPQETVAARGRDYEDVLDEIEAAREMQKKRGLEPDQVSNSTAGNPGSLMNENDDSQAANEE